MAAKRVYTPEEKLKIVLEGMSGTISVSDLCRKYDLKPARFYYWKDQLVNSAPEIFENRGRKVDEDRIRSEKDREIERLKATIAEVVQENLDIKKRLGSLAGEGNQYERPEVR
jgi:transposase